MLRIACFQFNANTIHLATSLEILQEWSFSETFILDYYWLGSSTKYPFKMAKGLDRFNSFKKSFPGKLESALRTVDFADIVLHTDLTHSNSQAIQLTNTCLKQFQSLNKIKEFGKVTYGSIPVGSAIANAIVTETGRREFNYKRDVELLKLLLTSFFQVYLCAQEEITKMEIDKVLIYNGRFIHERAVWEAAKSLNREVFLYETLRNRYLLRSGVGFHNRVENQRNMISLWEEQSKLVDFKTMEALSCKYFLDLESKKNNFYRLGTSVTLSSPYFVFFSNSDDEAIGFWDSWKETFAEQLDFIKQLQSLFELRAQEHLYIRLHPNLSNKPKEEQDKWLELSNKRYSSIIRQTEDTSSYALLNGAIGVLTYGSTIGIEAAFRKIPSAVLADCRYDNLGAVDKLKSMSEVEKWITNVSNSPVWLNLEYRRARSLILGYWMEKAGNPFVATTLIERAWGSWEAQSFNGRPLVESKGQRIYSSLVNRIKRFFLGLNNT